MSRLHDMLHWNYMNNFALIWVAPEYEHRPKGISWYWLTIIASALLIALAVWQENFLFAVFVVIAEILVLIWAGRKPRNITFSLSERGLAIEGAKSYPFRDIRAFSIDDEGFDLEWPHLILHFHHHFRPLLKVKLPKDRIEEARRALRTRVPEIPHEGSLMDAIEHLVRF